MSTNKINILPQIIVFLAGFSFLIFEISWNRLLAINLGSTVFASTLVLATFMGGLGLGGMFWGQIIQHHRSSRILSFLFGAIALAGIINYLFFAYGITSLYENISGIDYRIRELIVYLLAFVVLILAAFLMGGLLPILAKIVVHSNNDVSHHIGSIYALETLGSSLGGLSTGFIFLATFGQLYTVVVAIAIMIVLAVVAFRFLRMPELVTQEIGKTKTRGDKQQNLRQAALVLTFICGLSVAALQILWMRILKVYLTNTSYTFSIIASLVIVGLFVGSWYYKSQNRNDNNPFKQIANLLYLFAGVVVIGLIVLVNLPEAMLFPLHDLFNTHFTRLLLIPALVSIIVILPVAVISGYAFPMAIDLYTSTYTNVGQNVGRIMLFNALGGFLGPMLAAFVLIPIIGTGRGIVAIAFLVLLAVFFIIRNSHIPNLRKTARLAVGGIIVFLLIIISGLKMHILPPSFFVEEKKVIYYDEALQGTVTVGEASKGQNSVKSTYVNNASVIGSSYDAIKAVKMVGHLPFFAGLECKKALIVGFGIGVTTSSIAIHKEINRIDCVELVPGLKKAAVFYNSLNNNIINDPRLNLYGGDGRHFLQVSSEKYDFISSDPTHPVLGSGNLYTNEYFELYKQHLTENGMVTQYLPLHKLNRDDLLGLIKTFHNVFPNSVLWLGHYHGILMGSMQPIKIDFTEWAARINNMPQDPYFYAHPYHVASSLIFDSTAIANFPTDIKINTDDKSYVEFFDFSIFEEENLPANLAYFNLNRQGVYRVFQNIPDETTMKRFILGNELMTRGLEGMIRNNKKLLLAQLQKAMRVNPENEELPFLVKLYFRQ